MANGLCSGVVDQQNGGSGNQNGDDQEERRTNLIVNYLPEAMTQKEMLELFSGIGEVGSCKLVLDIAGYENDNDRSASAGASLTYGFVNFRRPEDAKNAINLLNGLRLQHKTIKVSYARPRSDAIKRTNIYVAGLPIKMSEQDFKTMFSSYGRIITSRILYDSLSSVSKGVGFIRFDQRLEAERAINELNGTIPNGCTEPITVRFARNTNDNQETRLPLVNYFSAWNICQFPPTSRFRYSPLAFGQFANSMFPGNALRGSGWSIFVYNLAPIIVEVVLRRLFEPFGVVQSVAVIRDKGTNKCRGFGFVTMPNFNEAINAIQALNGYTFANRVLEVRFKTNKSETLDNYKDDEVSYGLQIKRPRITVVEIGSKTY